MPSVDGSVPALFDNNARDAARHAAALPPLCPGTSRHSVEDVAAEVGVADEREVEVVSRVVAHAADAEQTAAS